MKSGSSTIAEYSYDAVGNRIQQTNGNGTSTEYAFDSDPRYRVTSITHKRGSNVLAQIGYPSRDSAGNPLGMTDWTGTWGYDYDSNNRLVGATPPNPVPGQPAGGPYGYDWVGNRIHPPGDPNPMVYNDGDQLVRWPGMYRYSYDDAGNLVQVRNDSQTQVLKSYTYTPAGLLATATFRDKDGNTRTFSNNWDADSNRVSFDANGTEYELVYDTTAGIPAVIEESTLGTTAYYIREPGGSLIARLNSTDGIRYYHFDELGSTRLLTDADGDITDKYAYDAYGSLLSHDCYEGSVDQPYQYVGRLGYYTHWMEPDFGLLQLGVRFCDPEVGRFTQRDPARRGLSSYAFLAGNPTARVDPLGLDWSTKDFVWHYYFGGGAAVDLADVGLLDDFQNARQTKNNVLSFRIQVRDRARKRAKEKCKGHSGLFRLGMGYYTSAMNHVGDERVSNPLYSVGGSKLFMSASCDLYVDCCKRVVVFYCMNTYSINDMFSDPYSGGFELGVAVPYDITAFWQEELAGHARF